MNRRLVTARMSVSRFSNAVSVVLRMSAGENKLKISSVDSGSSQNCDCTISSDAHNRFKAGSYRCPIRIVGGDVSIL
jgi:hypothetical protein